MVEARVYRSRKEKPLLQVGVLGMMRPTGICLVEAHTWNAGTGLMH